MSLPVKRVYIDTRFKTADSASTSHFRFELPRNLPLPDRCVFYVDDITIPHSWYTVEAGINDNLYFRYSLSGTGIGRATSLQIPPGQYTGETFRKAIQDALDYVIQPGAFQVTYNSNMHNLVIATTLSNAFFYVHTERDLATRWNGAWTDADNYYSVNNPASCNEILGNLDGTAAKCNIGNSFVSGFLDFLVFRDIYITSSNLGTFTALGVRGESNVIKKIPVSSDFGTMIIDSVESDQDFLDCSKQTLKTLEFMIQDVKGTVIPLHGANVSFTLVFSLGDDNV